MGAWQRLRTNGRRRAYGRCAAWAAGLAAVFCGCGKPAAPPPEVVVYVAHDQIYSEPILKQFEAETGIKAKIAFDTEASKTTGLVQRLIAEAANPRADVFWNNEQA